MSQHKPASSSSYLNSIHQPNILFPNDFVPELDLTNLSQNQYSIAQDFDTYLCLQICKSEDIVQKFTRIAKVEKQNAVAIAKVIEQRIINIKSKYKFRLLQLLDSIVRNISLDFIPVFSTRLVKTFTMTYKHVDIETRSQMRKVLSNWNGVFDQNILDVIKTIICRFDGEQIIREENKYSVFSWQNEGLLTKGNQNLMQTPKEATSLSCGFSGDAKSMSSHHTVQPQTHFHTQGNPTNYINNGREKYSDEKPTAIHYKDEKDDSRSYLRWIQFNEINEVSHKGAVKALYEDIPHQCSVDGRRFKDVKSLREHLDWIYYNNRSKREKRRTRQYQASFRGWYAKKDDLQDESYSDVDIILSEGKTSIVTNSVGETCSACHDEFETYWSDEEQQWMIKNAFRMDDGLAYHKNCVKLEVVRDEKE